VFDGYSVRLVEGYDRIAQLEQAITLEEDLARKYGEEARDYVIRKKPRRKPS
jgi:hypothetical protein